MIFSNVDFDWVIFQVQFRITHPQVNLVSLLLTGVLERGSLPWMAEGTKDACCEPSLAGVLFIIITLGPKIELY